MEATETMIGFERYSQYKFSGEEWLGEVPMNWNCIRMKHLFKDVSIKNHPSAELLSVTQDQGVVPRSAVQDRMVMPSGALQSFKYIEEGDFAISLRSFEGGLEYCHHSGIISPAYTVLKAKRNLVSAFYKYLFKSYSFISGLQTSVVGIREGKNISYEELSYTFLPIPPLQEQTHIAQFLDRKTAQIDQAIAQKEKLIELLKERRQILVQNAVTKGLDPNVKLKDSGVEWIGKIPDHWKVESFKNILVERNMKNEPIKSKERLSLSIDKGVTLYSEKTTNLDRFKDDFTQYKLAYKDDLVFNSMNMIVGAVGVSNYFGCVSPVYYTFYSRLLNPKITKYYEYFFKCRVVQSQLYCLGTGIMAIDRGDGKFNTVRLKVSRNDLRGMKVPYPSVSEITEIVDYIDSVNSNTEKVIRLQEQAIEKLKEYKVTLINRAVTGKIKV